jgi:ribonuclease HI
MNENFDYYVYTDGACSRNGKINAKAGIGIYFGENDPRNISECIIGKQTNNTAELKAMIKTFDIIKNDILLNKKIAIVSDSIYAIRCCTTYGEKCINSIKEIPNKELVKQAYKLYRNTNVKFIHIMAHTNNNDIHSIGNKNADKLAVQAITKS